FDEIMLGYFAALSYMVVANINVVTNAFGQAVTPRLAKLYSKMDFVNFNRILKMLCLLSILLGSLGTVCSIFIGEEILTFAYSSEYANYKGILTILMVSTVFILVSSFLGFGIIATRNFKVQPYLGGVWVVTNAITCFFLIPNYGMIGAAISVVITSVVQMISRWVVLYITIKRTRNSEVTNLKKLVIKIK